MLTPVRMANPSISIPNDLLDDFDDTIWELKKEGELSRNASRSEVIQMLMQEWVENNQQSAEAAD